MRSARILRNSILALVMWCAQTGVYAANQELPDFGDAAGSVFTPKQERRLGQTFMRYVRRSEKVVDDVLLTDYLEQLGGSLVQHSKDRSYSFDFFLVDNQTINAFAGPAGHIGVYTGLFLTTETEGELAAVLAHEISHVTQRHLLRAFHNASQQSVPAAALLLAAILLGAVVGGDAAMAAAVGGQAALIQQQIDFTRANEQEADRIGIDLLARSGFDPRAMPSFFSRMGKSNQTSADKIPEFLRTHPVTVSRIADASGRAEAYRHKQRPDSLRYHLAREMLRARGMEDETDAIRHYRATLRDGRYVRREANQYALIYALGEARRFSEARKLMDELLAKHPNVTEFVVSDALLRARTGNISAAISVLVKHRQRDPANYPIGYTLAELLLRHEQPQRAYELLGELLRDFGSRVELHKMMAEAAARTGRPAEANEHLADYQYLRGNTEQAVLQLEIALRAKGTSHYQSSRLVAKLEDFRRELKEEKADKKIKR